MSPKDTATFRVDTALLEAMRRIKDEKGVPVTTQIEMAVRVWLKSEYGIVVKAQGKRAPTRKPR